MREWAGELGFSQIGVADVDLSSAEPRLQAWLHNGFHGAMDYMAVHGMKRAKQLRRDEILVITLTGRGDKDVNQVAKLLGVSVG